MVNVIALKREAVIGSLNSRKLELKMASQKTVLDATQAELAAEKANVKMAEQKVAYLTTMMEKMHGQYIDSTKAETQKYADRLSTQNDLEIKARILGLELTSANGTISRLQADLNRVNGELSRSRIPKPSPNVPDFELNITAHDANGRIKSISIKPKGTG